MLEVTPPRARGFGSQALVVRGTRALPLDIAAKLRESYNEYPERYPLDFKFPQAGRRGPSRPAAQAEIVQSIFPMPRERASNLVTNPHGAPLPNADYLTSYREGMSIGHAPTVLATTTVVEVSLVVPSPALIHHVQFWSNSATPATATETAIVLKASQDNNTSGGEGTSGDVIEINSINNYFVPHSVAEQCFPNVVVDFPRWFLKMVFVNNNAAARIFYVITSLEFLE